VRLSIVLAIVLMSGCGRRGFDIVGGDPPPGDARVVDAPVYLLEAGSCPPAYDRIGSSCYRLGVQSASWFAAEATCEGDAVGAHLAIIADTTEANRLESAYAGLFWIGVTDRLVEGSYLDVTSAPLAFFEWDAGDPDGGPEDCLFLDGTAELEDQFCTDIEDFVCEYDGVAAIPSSYQ
jgi:hypothetical protein